MMKNFLTAMLGSIAGFWISLILLFVSFVIGIIIIASKDTSDIKLSEKAILYIDLKGDIIEREKPIETIYDLQSFDEQNLSYNAIISSIHSAIDDKDINGIYIKCEGSSLGVASRQEIVEAIKEFKSKSGKWVYSYANNYLTGDYYIATVSDSIFLNPVGMVEFSGLSATTLFYKNLMDKVGIEAQIIKVGTYKSAVEPFILTKMSEASREQQKHYMNNIWGSIKSEIAESRKTTAENVDIWADSVILADDPKTYKERKIVDNLYYQREVENILKQKLQLDNSEKLNLITPKEYCAQKNILNLGGNTSEHIAVLYATGDIVDNGDGGIVGEEMVPEILSLAENDNVKGLILRVNSGGGSAFASEQIWEALEQFKKTGKPFYVSMGDVAASGGYYISCGADCIYAMPTTITGSIGIFGIIPNIEKLLNDNIGITTDNVSTNSNGDVLSLIKPMNEIQQTKMQQYIERGYKLFTTRCAEGRNIPLDSILQIAEGRVWDGISAKQIGLIDEFGSLNTAINDMKNKTGVNAVQEYPIYESTLLNQLIISSNISKTKTNLIPTEFNAINEHLKFLNRMKNMSNIQCKMEDIVIR